MPCHYWERGGDEIPKTLVSTRRGVERAILAGVEVKGRRASLSLADSLLELGQLARTAGAQVVSTVAQHLDKPSRTYLGSGKLDELEDLVQEKQASMLILDDELSPAAQRVIEEAVKIKVIDRSALIIDIFAGRARSREGRLQVELAQHEYLLPRLAGQWSHLERLGGGIGTRGPGETQIETDRRLVERRIQRLKKELNEVREHRGRYRERRKEQQQVTVSLIGYTNAGKSTLFNRITRSGTLAEDRLFATLDPVTRRALLPSGAFCLLTDTVGFINKLPTGLVAAFRATLEELEDADLLVHVLDVSHPNAAEQERIVKRTLKEMGLQAKPILMAFNKVDRLLPEVRSEAEFLVAAAEQKKKLGAPELPTVLISAEKGWGVKELMTAVEAELGKQAGETARAG